jgi:hypothetical protein
MLHLNTFHRSSSQQQHTLIRFIKGKISERKREMEETTRIRLYGKK